MNALSKLACGLAAAFALGSASLADTLARGDASFLKKAAQAGHAEVATGKLAQSKAQDAQVKAFGERMVADHGKVGEELSKLAADKGVKLPAEPSGPQKVLMKRLEKSDGADFDRRYARAAGVDAHEDAVKLFRKAADSAKDADVKAFAQKQLPALEEHLKMAQALKPAADKK